MSPLPTASERVFATDANGVRRLVAAPGDQIPADVPVLGIVTTPDPVSAAVLPIDGYATLTEAQIVELLPTLDPETLAAVQAYEASHIARGSITRYGDTSKVVRVPRTTDETASLEVPAESTSAGYDGLSIDDLKAEALRRGLTLAGNKKALVAGLQAADAKA